MASDMVNVAQWPRGSLRSPRCSQARHELFPILRREGRSKLANLVGSVVLPGRTLNALDVRN